MRRIETKGVKHCSTTLLSRDLLHLHARKVELIGQDSCPFKPCEENSLLGEGFSFDYEKTTQLILDSHHPLYDVSERSVEISSSIDEATLTRALGFIASDVKITDITCKDPMFKELINVLTMDS